MSGEVKTVPVEPTKAMLAASTESLIDQYDANANWDDAKDVIEKLNTAVIYRAMLAAAPSTQPGPRTEWEATIEKRFPALNDHLIRMASTGNLGSLSEWGDFFNCLRAALFASPHEDYDSDEHGSHLYAWDEASREIFNFLAAAQPSAVLELIAAARANSVDMEKPSSASECAQDQAPNHDAGVVGELAAALEPLALLAEPAIVKMSDPLSKWFSIAQLFAARDALAKYAPQQGATK